jgi:hypothetical protein
VRIGTQVKKGKGKRQKGKGRGKMEVEELKDTDGE